MPLTSTSTVVSGSGIARTMPTAPSGSTRTASPIRTVMDGAGAAHADHVGQAEPFRQQIVLGAVKFPANQTAGVLGQRAELLQCRRKEFDLIVHLPALR